MTPLAPLLSLIVAVTPADVAALIEAGRIEQASALIEELPEAFRPRFSGLVDLAERRPEAAIRHLRAALEAEGEQPVLRLYLAHAQLLLGQPRAALEEAERARALAETVLAQPLVEARARRELDDLAGAFATLERATKAFPEESQPWLDLASVAKEAGLDGAAREAAARLSTAALDRDTALALFELLHSDPKARPLLEALAARFPRDAELRANLAYAYAAAEAYLAAARLFEQATRLGGDYAFEAADQYRVAARYPDALRLNARVKDPARRARQRLDILFDDRAYARVVTLAARAAPEAPEARYRVAYAHYALGERARATDLCRGLLDTGYAAPARALLKAMGRAEAAP